LRQRGIGWRLFLPRANWLMT